MFKFKKQNKSKAEKKRKKKPRKNENYLGHSGVEMHTIQLESLANRN